MALFWFDLVVQLEVVVGMDRWTTFIITAIIITFQQIVTMIVFFLKVIVILSAIPISPNQLG